MMPFQTLPALTSAALLGRPELAGAGGRAPSGVRLFSLGP